VLDIGQIKERQIYYTNIRVDNGWFEKLPVSNWLAFTIADFEDKELLHGITSKCLDNNVCYTCSVGQLGSDTEDSFDEEIAWRQVQEEETGKQQESETSPMTTFHKNFDEGFWFATTLANQIVNDIYIPIDKVVCIDFTKRGFKEYLVQLIIKINSGWLPPDN